MPKSDTKLPAFAKKLKELRMQQNWSLRDCEKRTGGNISRQTFLRAEQGDVSLSNLMRILDLYGLRKGPDREAQLASFNAFELDKARQEAA